MNRSRQRAGIAFSQGYCSSAQTNTKLRQTINCFEVLKTDSGKPPWLSDLFLELEVRREGLFLKAQTYMEDWKAYELFLATALYCPSVMDFFPRVDMVATLLYQGEY